MTIRVHRSFFVHPGAWLRSEIVEPSRISVTSLAASLHVSRQALSALLNGGAALSAEMAIRLEKAFGVNADTLVRMQAAHDLARARQNEAMINVEPLRALA